MMTTINVFKDACKTGEIFALTKLIEADLFDVNFIEIEDRSEKFSALKYAIKYGTTRIVELLLAEGANVNENFCDYCAGKTPLIVAVESMQIEKLHALLKYGADIRLKDNLKKSALQHALNLALNSYVVAPSDRHNIELCDEQFNVILDYGCKLIGASPSITRHRTFCQIFRAVIERDADSVRKLIKTINNAELRKVEPICTPLRYAIRHRIWNILNIYLECDPQDVLFSSIDMDDTIVPKWMFVNYVIDINMRDQKGRTALHRSSKNTELFRLFLEHGVNPEIRSEDNEFPECSLEEPSDDTDSDCSVVKYFKKLNLIDPEYVENQTSIILGNRVNRINLFEEVVQEYADELEILKSTRISQSTSSSPAITLFDYLFLKPNEVIRFQRNENLVKLWQETDKDFSKKYPHYGFAINYQYRRGMFRKNLIKEAGEILFSAIGSKALIDTTGEIFQYFNTNSLIKFIG